MKTKALVTAILAATSASVSAAPEDIYVTGSALYVNSDESRSLESTFSGAIGLGWWLHEKIGVEIELNAYDLDLVDSVGEVEIDGYNLQGKYYFRGSRNTTPYLGLGFGELDSSSSFGRGSDRMIDIIGGLSHPLNDFVAGEVEFRYRFDGDDDSVPGADDFEDWLVSVGLTVAFGPRYAEKAAPAPQPASTPQPILESDSDGDGVVDSRDRCPNTPAGMQVDSNGCPLDTDGDRVRDDKDDCPDTPRGNVVGADGCDKDVVVELNGVFFDFDKATLKPEATETLNEGVKILKNHPDINVEVAGHTDSRGSAEYNQNLSQRRANAVREFLISNGIRADRLTTRGYGESKPIADNSTEDGRARNRRVELRVENKKM